MKHLWKGLILVILYALLFPVIVLASVDELDITQIIQKEKNVYLYISALQGDGVPTEAALSADQFEIQIDEEEKLNPVQADVFEVLDQGISYTFCVEVSRSVTDQWIQNIREGLTEYVNGMGEKDFARILLIGEEPRSICDSTQNKEAMLAAIGTIERTEEASHLYQGISNALEDHREHHAELPDRAVVIVFSDGADDSAGDTDENALTKLIADVRIPIYVIGLNGEDSGESLDSISRIVRKSGGAVYSAGKQSVSEALHTVGEVLQKSIRLLVLPDEADYGRTNQKWKVACQGNGDTVSSGNYVYSLNMPEETSVGQEDTENDEIDTSEMKTDLLPDKGEDRPVGDRMKAFLLENLFLIIAVILVLLAITIIIVTLIREKKKKNTIEEIWEDESVIRLRDMHADPYLYDEFANGMDKTVDEFQEKTVREIQPKYYEDDEATVAVHTEPGIRMSFQITFEEKQKRVEKILFHEIKLGRGDECDVDVVLNADSEARKLTSRKHAAIINRPDGIYIRDEKAMNKTYVNGEQVTGEVPLRSGSLVQLGNAMVEINYR